MSNKLKLLKHSLSINPNEDYIQEIRRLKPRKPAMKEVENEHILLETKAKICGISDYECESYTMKKLDREKFISFQMYWRRALWIWTT